jgi:ABC-type transport system involved in multi-copper enzyme maturation permease subunit
MGNILKSDMYKLLRDRQTIVLVIIYSLVSVVSILSVSQSQSAASVNIAKLLDWATMDFAFILILVTLVASAPYALDYSNDTLKDILPYYPRAKVFTAKWVAALLAAFTAQLFCYLLGLLYCLVIAGSLPNLAELGSYANRFVVHYLINISNVSLVLFLGSFFRQRAIINALVLVSLLLTRFFPIGKNQFLFNYLNLKYEWGASLDFLFIIGTLVITVLFIASGYCFFRAREV